MKNFLITFAFILITNITYSQKAYTKVNPSGIIEETGFYSKAGLKDSTWISYNEKGTIVQEAHFSNGIKVGHWKTYFDDGSLMYDIPYENGIKKGKAIQLNQNGELIASKNY